MKEFNFAVREIDMMSASNEAVLVRILGIDPLRLCKIRLPVICVIINTYICTKTVSPISESPTYIHITTHRLYREKSDLSILSMN